MKPLPLTLTQIALLSAVGTGGDRYSAIDLAKNYLDDREMDRNVLRAELVRLGDLGLVRTEQGRMQLTALALVSLRETAPRVQRLASFARHFAEVA